MQIVKRWRCKCGQAALFLVHYVNHWEGRCEGCYGAVQQMWGPANRRSFRYRHDVEAHQSDERESIRREDGDVYDRGRAVHLVWKARL